MATLEPPDDATRQLPTTEALALLKDFTEQFISDRVPLEDATVLEILTALRILSRLQLRTVITEIPAAIAVLTTAPNKQLVPFLNTSCVHALVAVASTYATASHADQGRDDERTAFVASLDAMEQLDAVADTNIAAHIASVVKVLKNVCDLRSHVSQHFLEPSGDAFSRIEAYRTGLVHATEARCAKSFLHSLHRAIGLQSQLYFLSNLEAEMLSFMIDDELHMDDLRQPLYDSETDAANESTKVEKDGALTQRLDFVYKLGARCVNRLGEASKQKKDINTCSGMGRRGWGGLRVITDP